MEVREEVRSPYIVGARVPPERLVGREDLLTDLRRIWGKRDARDSVVIFGHRRMGKSSLVWSLAKRGNLGEDTTLVVLNIQSVDWSQNLVDLCYTIAFTIWQARPLGGAEPQPDTYTAHPLQALRRFLATLQQRQDGQRYILILDEYEALDQNLPTAEAEALVTTLRGFTQDFSWLAVALVGLHTLQERSARYYSPLYSWRTLKVGFLTRDGVADLLQWETDEFPLEYSLAAVDRVAALTGGQAYLVQLVGDSLVQAFNARFRQATVPPEATLTAADVDAVVADPAFYEGGGGYFHGIWDQAAEGPLDQRALLQALAAAPDPLSAEDLAAATGLTTPTVAAALETLAVHDVLRQDAGCWVYTVPLMQRWVAGFAPPS